MLKKMIMFAAEAPTPKGQVNIVNPGSCVETRQSPQEGGRNRKMLKRVLMIFVVALVIGSLNTSVLAADAYYPFNGNANDESGNGFDGIVHGATLCPDRFGNPDSAYSFGDVDLDGYDYIEVPSSPTATTYVDFSAWVRLDAVGSRDGGYILNKGSYLIPETYSLSVTDTVHLPNARVNVGGVYYIAESAVGLQLGEWTHFRGVYDGVGPGAGLTLYVDGNSMDYVAVSGALDQNSESLYFGCDYGNSLSVWEGSIDDVSITVPEPTTLSMLAIGGLAIIRRKSKIRRGGRK